MQSLIDPLVLASIKDMPLVAKTVAQGLLHGLHGSVQRGTGLEFSQYRAYEPGDALGNIDWKLFARSDRYFVREAERESNVNIWLVIDASASMLQHSSESNQGWHKFDYAKHLLATIAYIAHKQSDAIGLLGLSSESLHFLPALSGKQHWQKLLVQLNQMSTGSVFPSPQVLQHQLSHMQSNSLIFVLSDFYQKNNEIVDFMQNLIGKRTEVIAMQLESNDELTFPYKGQIRFEDRESKQQILVSADEAKIDYFAARQAWQDSLKKTFGQLNIQHCIANIDQPLDKMLHRFLAARQKFR
ncbi:DUF58 domain-containing protein [uncultured Paraglaciecola sp.]|jgi:uncharacterized protein (DUF58 family)|uniref:DUF58 domain-containing protein n=1 Tax=uncultured Paraglaciecola sp. TaxID=1765024 RepID=UPI0025EAB124|nr:DUF58 domain-containing protein [uncultured Paraglaciecola sp.]